MIIGKFYFSTPDIHRHSHSANLGRYLLVIREVEISDSTCSENNFPLIIPLCFFHLFQAGRDEREKFGRSRPKMNPNASKTNKEKKRNKNYMMVKHKLNKKQNKRSFRDKQVNIFFIPFYRLSKMSANFDW